jgi:hypothetical protein
MGMMNRGRQVPSSEYQRTSMTVVQNVAGIVSKRPRRIARKESPFSGTAALTLTFSEGSVVVCDAGTLSMVIALHAVHEIFPRFGAHQASYCLKERQKQYTKTLP